MLRTVLSIGFLSIALCCAFACGAIQLVMVRTLAKEPESRMIYTYFSNDGHGIFQEHKRFFPQSKLRSTFASCAVVLICSIIGLAVIN